MLALLMLALLVLALLMLLPLMLLMLLKSLFTVPPAPKLMLLPRPPALLLLL